MTTLVSDAARYDSWFDTSWGRYAAEVEYSLVLRALKPEPLERILDAGCGTGRFSERLGEYGATVIGVDHDPNMLELAKARSRGVALADAHRLPFESGVFDATLAVTLCEFSGDPGGVVDELARVTRPGGRVVIGLLNRNSPWGWLRRKRLKRPPWSDAVFVDAQTLRSKVGTYGTTSLTSGLFSPGTALPWSLTRLIESAGRRLVPKRGAFQVIAMVRQ
ncbi:MAG: SAM-dependent methyltransferase [Acidobacteria bacterium]|nr:MAG: SAM-dependent methyltransferase [Acidobacteriota bacterium]